MAEEILNLGLYNDRMSKSIQDKLFFIPLVEGIDTLVDFGCANGELFKYCPGNWHMIGIDDSEQMIKEAGENFPAGEYVRGFADLKGRDLSNAALNLSSVIHEVYSYLPIEKITQFWHDVFNSGFRYIAIRDMAISPQANRHWDIDEVLKISNNENGKLFNDYRTHFSECRQRDLIHFLLKYKYVENWQRESRENYFPLTNEEMVAMIPESYQVRYQKNFVLEYTRNQVLKDFGYYIKDPTHIKLILERNQPL